MRKSAVVLVAMSALSVMLMVVAPVQAKPYEVIVAVKDAAGNPVVGTAVYLNQVGGPSTLVYATDRRGNVKIPISKTASWSTSLPFDVWVYDKGGTHYDVFTGYYLNRYSAKILITTPY